MPKRRSSAASRSRALRWLGALAALALAMFLVGEIVVFAASDRGRVLLADRFGLGDHAQVVRVVGLHIREGLAVAGVPPAAVHEATGEGGARPALAWRIELPRDGSPTQANIAITRAVERVGAHVFSGRERMERGGMQVVTLRIGVHDHATHELEISRPGRAPGSNPEDARATRIAIVVFGALDSPAAHALLQLSVPLAVAVPAAGEGREAALREAAASHREIVLLVPMEPENYPRANPGPGTLLVSMSAGRIASLTRGYLDGAPGAVALSNYMGGFATQDEPFMTAVFRELKRARMPFLHVLPAPHSVCRELAAHLGVAYDEPDAILDGETRGPKPTALSRAWRAALDHSRRGGHAIVWLRATPTSAAWAIKNLPPSAKDAAAIVPLSSILHRPTPQ